MPTTSATRQSFPGGSIAIASEVRAVSKQRAKGTLAETALVKYLRAQGVGDAKRQPLSGNKDIGDVVSHDGRVIWEVKNYSGSAALGQPTEKQLSDWLSQAEAEANNADALYGVLVVKRKGTTDVGRWWSYWDGWDLHRATGMPGEIGATLSEHPICMSVASTLAILNNEVAFR